MKKLLFMLGFILPFFAFSQSLSDDFEVSTATPYEVVDGNSKEFIYTGNGHIISVKTDGDKIATIQKFDVNGMKEVIRNDYKDLPKYTIVQGLIHIKDKIYYIYEAYNKKSKNFTVYSREIDEQTASFKPEKSLFTSSREVVAPRKNETDLFYLWGGIKMPKFAITPPFDESKILFSYRSKPLKKRDAKNNDELGFYVFDNNLNKIWGKEVIMPHTEKEMNNLAYTVDQNGTVFMIDRLNETKSIELITISENDFTNKKLPVKEGLMFKEFDLRANKKGNIVAAGYYANGIDVKFDYFGGFSASFNVNGLYLFELDKSGEVLMANDYPFPIDLIKKNLTERATKKADDREEDGNAGIGDLTLREFEINDDGSIVVIGEVYYTKKELWLYKTDFVTHFGDIVITKINPDGTVAWMDKLPKNQASLTNKVTVGGLGIAYVHGDDSHYLLFADNRNNANLAVNEHPAAHKGGYGGYLTAYKINDATGDIEKHLILDLTDINGKKAHQFDVSRIMEAGKETFLLEFYMKGKKDTMVKMKLG